ncbi:unnamed protein product [Callosobruchus maculatus]|uniref:Uncharacterized protein n=1 Tax=Callosobruchus maculatus TaxID=64391 RepID=A0A653C863_CALMS|nr:unnamed protein product [Callosobruchus maculatus]
MFKSIDTSKKDNIFIDVFLVLLLPLHYSKLPTNTSKLLARLAQRFAPYARYLKVSEGLYYDPECLLSDVKLSETLQSTKNDLSDIEIPSIPEDIIFPDELNRYLRDQIRYYLQENCMLKKNLEDLESEYNDCKALIREMEMKLKKSNEMEKFVPSNQVTSIKIVELSKKLREKTSEVESLKSKCSKLKFQLFQLQNQNDVPQEKLNTTQNKLSELNNANLQLKNDLKLANKYLQQEIGDGFESLHTFSSNPGNWRGRAQIICDLQQKNSDLKEKLKALQENSNSTGSESNISLIKMESKLSLLSKENSDMKSKFDGLKRKYEASQARIKTFENDCTLLKTKLTMLQQQSDRDQDIISTLSAQISNSKNSQTTVLNHKERTINKLEKEKEQLVKELEEYKSVISHLKNELKGAKNDICKFNDNSETNNTTIVNEDSQGRIMARKMKISDEEPKLKKRRYDRKRREQIKSNPEKAQKT